MAEGDDASGIGAPRPRIMFVCTANLCRSPMAELLLVEALRRRGVTGTVSSAGLLHEGRPADRKAVAALRRRGLDLSGHRSRLLSESLVQAHDLVLTMERRHLERVVDICPEGWPRTFVFNELLCRAGTRGGRTDDDLTTWTARMHHGRRPAEVVRGGAEYDVLDPVGGSSRDFRRTASVLETAVDQLATALGGKPHLPGSGEHRGLGGRWLLRRH